MNQMDLIRSLDWLAFCENAHARGQSQDAIDKRAFSRVHYFKAELSPTVLELYEDAIVDAFDSPRQGRPEECMSVACRTVIKMATEEEWKQLVLDMDPLVIDRWRKYWDEVRNSMSRTEQLYFLWEAEQNGGSSDWRKTLTDSERAEINDWDAEEADAHNCREHMDADGCCTWCGSIVPGTNADYTEHGYDPPEPME